MVDPNVKISTITMSPAGTLNVSGTVAEDLGAPQTVTVTVSWPAPPPGSPVTGTATSSGGQWSVSISGVPEGVTVTVTARCRASSDTDTFPEEPASNSENLSRRGRPLHIRWRSDGPSPVSAVEIGPGEIVVRFTRDPFEEGVQIDFSGITADSHAAAAAE